MRFDGKRVKWSRGRLFGKRWRSGVRKQWKSESWGQGGSGCFEGGGWLGDPRLQLQTLTYTVFHPPRLLLFFNPRLPLFSDPTISTVFRPLGPTVSYSQPHRFPTRRFHFTRFLLNCPRIKLSSRQISRVRLLCRPTP